MKIATRNDPILIRENVRIIGYAVDLSNEYIVYKLQRVVGSAVDLRYTPEGIGILNVLLGPILKLAVFQKIPDPLSSFNLAGLGSNLVDQRIERLNAAIECVQ